MSSYVITDDDYLAKAELDSAGISDVLILSRNNLSVGALDIGDCGCECEMNAICGDM